MQAGRALKHRSFTLLYLRQGTGDWVCAELLFPTWEKIPNWTIPWWFWVCVWEQRGKLIQLGGGGVFGGDHQLGSEQWPCSARTWAESLENPKLWGSCGITGVRGSGSCGGSPGPCSGPCGPANTTLRWLCPCWGGGVCAPAEGVCAPAVGFVPSRAFPRQQQPVLGAEATALLSPSPVCSSCVCAMRAPARWRGQR